MLAVLFDRVLLVTVRVPLLKMPPPPSALPSSMVSPEMETVTAEATSTTPTAPSPLTASALAPDPAIVTLVSMSMVLESVMVEQEGERANAMMSPELAFSTAWRNDPDPESLQLVTV